MSTIHPDTVDDHLSEPSAKLIALLSETSGDMLLLGVGGKMGTTMTLMVNKALRASNPTRTVHAASRFSRSEVKEMLAATGVRTWQGDLFDDRFLAALPECENVFFMAGHKFGTSADAGMTWATNALLPGLVCRRFATSRIVAFSTGNVYPLVRVDSGGSKESDPLNPIGEYAMSALARERILQHFAIELDIPMVVLRLNYSTELRYGVLVDLARQVAARQPISLTMGHFNCIWQRDACDLALRSLSRVSVPPLVLNLTGPDVISVREVCEQMGRLFDVPITFVDSESETALLSNSRRAMSQLGHPETPLDVMIEHTCAWVKAGGPTWGKPTHFQTRDGSF